VLQIAIKFTLILQKSKLLQIQGAEGEAVVIYCEPLATQVEDPENNGEMRHPRLSHWVNNMAVFTIFMMSPRVNSIKGEKKFGNAIIIVIKLILPCYLCNNRV